MEVMEMEVMEMEDHYLMVNGLDMCTGESLTLFKSTEPIIDQDRGQKHTAEEYSGLLELSGWKYIQTYYYY